MFRRLLKKQEKVQNHPGDLSEEQVRLKAYYLWESAGRPEGQELDFWTQAEREVCPNCSDETETESE